MSDEAMSNFTPRAQQVLALARKEADRFNHNFVGTEHLLLGLIKLGQGVAVNVLQKMGLDLETVRMEVEKQVGTGPDQKMIGNIPYTPRVKKVLDLARREAKNLNHTYIGTEHLLLGLLREGDGIAAQVLRALDVDIEEARQRVTEIAGGGHFGPVGERRQAGWFLSSLWHAGSASRRNLTMSRQTLLTTASAKCIGRRTLPAFVGNGGVRTHARGEQ